MQIFGGGGLRLAAGEVHQVGPEPGGAELGLGVEDVVAGDALALAPAPGLIRAEAGTANLLGVARGAAQIGINRLAAGREARQAGRMRLAVGLIKEGGQRAQLAMGPQHEARPGDQDGGEEAEKEERPAFHEAEEAGRRSGAPSSRQQEEAAERRKATSRRRLPASSAN